MGIKINIKDVILIIVPFCTVFFISVDDLIAQNKSKDQLLWTTEPVRVKPSTQELKRLPSKRETSDFPDIMLVPESVRVEDSITFVTKDGKFRLAFVEAVPSYHICRNVLGQRWSCGLQSRMNLRTLIAGKQITCKKLSEPESGIFLINCELRPGETLAATLLRSGSAIAIEPAQSDLKDVTNFAIETRAGIWSDETFYQTHKNEGD